MDFDIMKFFEDQSNNSPGSLGGKIKKYRELRGWSQKELGIRCGFAASSADVRIAQYEKDKKVPREKALKDIAYALEIDESALFDANMNVYNQMYHALFEIEDFHGLHPIKIGNNYYLEFSGFTAIDQRNVTKRVYQAFLKEWDEKRQEYLPKSEDSEKEKADKYREYALWRGEYPKNVADSKTERLRDQLKMDRLQAEMDALNAKMKSDAEISRLNNALNNVMDDVRSSYKPLSMESEFIILIKDMIEKGVNVERFSPEELLEPDYDTIHLLSIRTEEILTDEEKVRLYAGFSCAVETLKQYGIQINRKITSRDKELFVTYSYPSSQYMYFENLNTYWADMVFITDRKGMWPDWKLKEYEEKFEANITGEGDVSFKDKLDEG